MSTEHYKKGGIDYQEMLTDCLKKGIQDEGEATLTPDEVIEICGLVLEQFVKGVEAGEAAKDDPKIILLNP